MLMVSVCVFALFIVLSCVFADRIGRRRVIIGSSVALLAFAALFPLLMNRAVVGVHNTAAAMLFPVLGFALMGIAFGPIGALLPELFSVNVRYTGSGIGYNIAAIVGAAFVRRSPHGCRRTGVSARWGLYLASWRCAAWWRS